MSPADPVVGDDIKVTAFASGDGGLPKYTLILEDEPALLALESPASVTTGGPLGEPANWTLGTLAEGRAHFHISVNYEREFCSPTECWFAFTNENSPQVTVGIDATPRPVGGVALDDGLAPLGRGASGFRAVTWVVTAGGVALCLVAGGWASKRRARS